MLFFFRNFLFFLWILPVFLCSHESPFRKAFASGNKDATHGLPDEEMERFDRVQDIFRSNFDEFLLYRKENSHCHCYDSGDVKALIEELRIDHANFDKIFLPIRKIRPNPGESWSKIGWFGSIFGGLINDKLEMRNSIADILEAYHLKDFYEEMESVCVDSSDGGIVDDDDDDDDDDDEGPSVDDLEITRGLVLGYGLFRYCFFYSQFRNSFLDLATTFENCKQETDCDSVTISKGIDAVYLVLGCIQNYYLDITQKCLLGHPHPKTHYERGLIYYDQGNNAKAIDEINKMVVLGQRPEFKWALTSEMYQAQGNIYADEAIYDLAINSLTQAIQQNPKGKEAYLDRALCFLDQGKFDLAVCDFVNSNKKSTPLLASHVSHLLFAKGFVSGVTNGSVHGIKDFIPSTVKSLHGIGHALWAFACDPICVSQELILGCKNIVSYLETIDLKELPALVVPEIKALMGKWQAMEPEAQGRAIGYVIGKYGIEIFAGLGVVKGAKMTVRAAEGFQLYHNLRKAEAIVSLEVASKDANAARKIKSVSLGWKKRAEKNLQLSKEIKAGQSASQVTSEAIQSVGSKEIALEESLKVFTEKNYRKNFIKFMGFDPGSKVDAHHVFPQTFRERFLEKGINIDEARFLTWWEKSNHQKMAKAYNVAWDEFMLRNPEATKAEILKKGKEIMFEFGFTTHF